ncbi:DUF5916 domain-containing protein [Gemmatimonadota bacterium]
MVAHSRETPDQRTGPKQETINSMIRSVLSLFLMMVCCLGQSKANAQVSNIEINQNPETINSRVTIPRLVGEFLLDGIIEATEWEQMLPLDMTMYQPVFEGEMSEKTEVRIGHDGQYIYLLGKLFDSAPEGIRVNSLSRDKCNGDDSFGVVIDTWNDNENALCFAVNPAGVRLDMAISNDADPIGNPNPINYSWNAFWDIATDQDHEGWYAEIRIPFSSLGFNDDDGQVIMGLIVSRFIARKNELHTWPAIPPNWQNGSIKPSRGHRVQFEGVRSQNPIYLSPYFLGGLAHYSGMDGTSVPAGTKNDQQVDVGLDLKTNLTSNLTLNLSLNTDFAQVEIDDQMVNLSRFSLFYPEKRQFFQERSSLFDFPTIQGGRLFYSRRIGITEDGEPVRILGGGRLVGQIGNWDVGIINMQTSPKGSLPSENLGVLRIRRQILNPFSFAGGIVTSRLGNDGKENIACGIDSQFRLFGDDYLIARLAQTFDREQMNRSGYHPQDGNYLQVQWRRRRILGLHYILTFAQSGDSFEPGLGFFPRNDFQYGSFFIRHNQIAKESSPLYLWGPDFFVRAYFRNTDGHLETGLMQLGMTFEFKNGMFIETYCYQDYERLETGYSLSDEAEVPAGEYNPLRYSLDVGFPRTGLIQLLLSINAGQFFDGTFLDCSAGLVWWPSEHFELGVEYDINLVRFPDRAQRFNAHVGRLRLQTTLNTHLSVNTFLQYNSVSEIISLNSQLRYFISEGRDLWLVFTDTRNVQPAQPLFEDFGYRGMRTIILKYTHTIIR